MEHHDPHTRCLALIERLNRELQWGLDTTTQIHYMRNLQPYVSDDHTEDQLQTIIKHYHLDHALVEALKNRQHQNHDNAWQAWTRQAMRILCQNGLHWSRDVAIEYEDLSQLVQIELVRSIHNFRYQSRFSTWSYRLIVQSIQRHIRNSMARKRAVQPDSLDQIPTLEVPITSAEHPEAIVNAQILASQITSILANQPDQRLKMIFQLWAVEDKRIIDIGTIVNLRSSRVRALVRHIQHLLREHPDIRSWYLATEERADA